MPAIVSISLPSEQTRRKLRRRILPFVFLLYVVSYLDRANVAFAKMPMSADLGFSDAVYGFGAGIFFIGYMLFGIPGAMLVERGHASRWIARMLIAWGSFAFLAGFVKTPGQFYACRFTLGCAEAGFFPGIIVYFSHWFARQDRARAFAGFIMGIPVSLVLGAPFSALILRVHWLGLPGWRWVFILQGIAPVILGVVTFFYLTDYPRQAKWLTPDERAQIEAELEQENAEKTSLKQITPWQALRLRNVVLLAVALCSANVGGYAFVLWLPSIIRNSSTLSVGMATACSALPFAAGLFSVGLSARASDRSGERRLHTAVPMLLTGLFFTLAAIPGQPFGLVLAWLCLTGASGYAWPPAFWVLPTVSLTKSAAAASIGLINVIGNLGGFLGPSVVGLLLSHHYSYSTAIAFLSVCFLLAGTLVLTIRLRPEGS
jgi:ACS family tartrate transporter-like MFS transporter